MAGNARQGVSQARAIFFGGAAPEGLEGAAVGGILLVGPSKGVELVGPVAGAPLPGAGQAKERCGAYIRAQVCPRAAAGAGAGLLGGLSSNASRSIPTLLQSQLGVGPMPRHRLTVVRNSCDSASCPECWPDWSLRAAERAEERLLQVRNLKGYLAPRHVAVSPPQLDAVQRVRAAVAAGDVAGAVRWLRVAATVRAGRAGLEAAAVVVHLYRCRLPYGVPGRYRSGELVVSPHVHFIGFGGLASSSQFHEETKGWIYRNLEWVHNRLGRTVRDVADTMDYLLQHAPVVAGVQAVAYTGAASNSKLVIAEERVDLEAVHCECGERCVDVDVHPETGEPVWALYDETDLSWRKKRVRVYAIRRPPKSCTELRL